jgi:hypothetical protein
MLLDAFLDVSLGLSNKEKVAVISLTLNYIRRFDKKMSCHYKFELIYDPQTKQKTPKSKKRDSPVSPGTRECVHLSFWRTTS